MRRVTNSQRPTRRSWCAHWARSIRPEGRQVRYELNDRQPCWRNLSARTMLPTNAVLGQHCRRGRTISWPAPSFHRHNVVDQTTSEPARFRWIVRGQPQRDQSPEIGNQLPAGSAPPTERLLASLWSLSVRPFVVARPSTWVRTGPCPPGHRRDLRARRSGDGLLRRLHRLSKVRSQRRRHSAQLATSMLDGVPRTQRSGCRCVALARSSACRQTSD